MFTRQTKYNTSTNNTITKKQMNKQKKKSYSASLVENWKLDFCFQQHLVLHSQEH